MNFKPMPSWLAKLVHQPLSESQTLALVCWAEDVKNRGAQGPEDSVESSELLYHLNRGNFQVAAAEFTKWCLVKGRLNNTKLASRRMEQLLFSK